MELRHLRYFVAVAEALSFRQAARRLSVSAAALSQQVGDLEDELGLKLFHRNSRRVELTEVGRVFLGRARRLLVSAQEAVAQAHEAARGERGRLSIGTCGALMHGFLPEALARFRQRFPLVEVTVLHLDNRTQVEALLNGAIMVGLGYVDPTLEEGEALTATPLLRSAFCIACAEGRGPAKRGRPQLSDFRQATFLALATESGGDYLRVVRGVCQREGGFDPTFLQVGNSLESVLSMVAAGRGVFLAPELVFGGRSAGVRVHVLDGLKGEFEVLLRRRGGPDPAATVDHFAKLLAESVRHLQTPG